ncbi:hypothetical protein GRI62_02870 [Erythrobacter arachoides]|uniref:Uncharacterized protein n=1 Tax=Aurantiacibacter arachoides TaxID=1850444 RepID=A0A845A0P4_9SPHN|nr:hypothetical protein [Aurantiacibacter arachoides]MXO92547.1 hypothetical protein [Aurantiacibacter arachoides]GGD56320.1 hypothetical protein GCM10011411_15410 [Aurantiacibacter arachoides]
MEELIPILGIIMIIVIVITTNRRKLEEKRLAMEDRRAASPAPDTSAEKARVADLEDRVRVLERIVTDRGYDLAAQIEALRDQRREDERAMTDGSGVKMDFAKKEKA